MKKTENNIRVAFLCDGIGHSMDYITSFDYKQAIIDDSTFLPFVITVLENDNVPAGVVCLRDILIYHLQENNPTVLMYHRKKAFTFEYTPATKNINH